MSSVLVVIPARWGSTRLPGKALADLGGRPLVVRTAEAAARMVTATEVVVATDDPRICEAVSASGLACELTAEHPTGTDRVGEVARRRGPGGPADIVVNLQGDEPLLDPADADRLVAALRDDPSAAIATAAHPLPGPAAWADPNVVKVLMDRAGRALYFSRAPIPGAQPDTTATGEGWRHALRHVGIYAFRRPALDRFLALGRGELEQAEGLEQLRALEHGLPIRVVTLSAAPVGVDTPADLERVRALWRARHG
ncbi:MAG: 3-deoxy-manno-octulosonate cytidylyltransferase [Candidatus Krumholzibacteriia bacterium]